MKEKVIIYIDGFNLYFGIRSKYPNFKWLNLMSLASNLIKSDQEVIAVKYFTARINNDPAKQKRQSDYIDVLQDAGVEVIYGKYQSNTIKCNRCGAQWSNPNEKMTDVNIATTMLFDATHGNFDTAILISGDSDLTPPLSIIKQYYPAKRVVVAFPPDRHNNTVAAAASGNYVLGRAKLSASQFADSITLKNGYTIRKPQTW